MSGGSYNYAFRRVDEFADEVESRLRRTTRDEDGNRYDRYTPEQRARRLAFIAHLRLVSEAMRAVEWEDSGDGADEEAAIAAVLNR